MHGRLKVKTTAQQEADKKKERAVKLGGWSTYDESKTYDESSTYDENSTFDDS